MKKRFVTALLCLSTFLVLPGCASILDGDFSTMTPHEKPVPTASGNLVIANTYDDLKKDVIDLVMKHETAGLIRADTYSGDIEKDADRVTVEIMANNPFAAYAVENLSAVPKQIVAYYEITVHIDYRDDTIKKLDTIASVSNLPSLKAALQEKLSSYAPSLTVLAKGLGQTTDDLTDMIKQLYYENPSDIVMLPVTPLSVKFYPDHGPDQIIQFTFLYRYESGMLKAMAENLKFDVQRIAGSIPGSSYGALLLNACQRLMSITEYDEKKAKSGDYSTQNFEATAYGAIENHSAVGEGYAMAFKALCDQLGIECYVVLGERGNMPQAWNIVRLDGYYYHIDVSMCDVNGIATAFLKDDADMKKSYTWDSSKYKVCNGTQTYQSLLSTLPSPSASASPSGSPSSSPSGSPAASPSGGIHTT